jgi:hypothetical protein
MESEQRQAAKKQMMVLMQEGYPWQEAASRAGIRISRSTAYRCFQQFRAKSFRVKYLRMLLERRMVVRGVRAQ